MLAMFTDASSNKHDGPSYGAYSVVFRNNCPGVQSRGQYHEMAWNVPDLPDSLIGEFLAFAQGLRVTEFELRAIKKLRGAAATTVVLAIFSDSFEVLRMVKNGYYPRDRDPYQNLIARTVRLIWQQSHNVCNIPGYNVRIHAHWVKGHSDVAGNDRADCLAKEARKDSRNLYRVAGQELNANLLSPAVHIPLLDDMERLLSRQHPVHAQPAQHGHPRNGLGWNDRAQNRRPQSRPGRNTGARVGRGQTDRDMGSHQRYPHGRDSHQRSLQRVPPHPRESYSSPPWARESFHPELERITVPPYPRAFPTSSLEEHRPRNSQCLGTGTNKNDDPYDLGLGPGPGETREPMSTRRGNNAPSLQRVPSNSDRPYNPPSRVSAASNPNLKPVVMPRLQHSYASISNPNHDPIAKPRLQRNFSPSSPGRHRPHVAEYSRPETNQCEGPYLDYGPDPRQHPGQDRVSASNTGIALASGGEKREAEGRQSITHKLANNENLGDQDKTVLNQQSGENMECQSVLGNEASLHERFDEPHPALEDHPAPSNVSLQEESMKTIDEPVAGGLPVVKERGTTPESFIVEEEAASQPQAHEPIGQTSVSPMGAEQDESEAELFRDAQSLIDAQDLAECPHHDELPLVHDMNHYRPDETHIDEDDMSEEQMQAAVDRQLEQEAEAALARMMASETFE